MTAYAFKISRWSVTSRVGSMIAIAAVALLALAPAFASHGTLDRLIALFVYILLAAMWNALAGYGGLVSIGQQMFFGCGAYFTIRLADAGIDPYLSMLVACLFAAFLAWLISLFMLRLRGGEFAVGMWVLASVSHLMVNLDPLIQGETGTSLISLNGYEASTRIYSTYWLGLAVTAAVLLMLFALLRGRAGIAIQAIRDSEEAAASLGVDILATKRKLFVLAALGIGAAGALWLASAMTFQPRAYFGVHWSAYMIFMVLVGGIATFEGAILGAIIFFAFETWFGGTGVWYLIGLGAVALFLSLFFPKGVWGSVSSHLPGPALPLGYHVSSITQTNHQSQDALHTHTGKGS